MKQIYTIFILIILMSSCTEEYQSRIIDDISIKTFRIDSVSIRTIVAVDADKVYFAASNGRVGYQWDEQKFEQIKFIKYADSISPNFRSLATNGTDYFALSIGNPALLYNLSKDTLVYKETHEKVFYDSMKFFDTLNLYLLQHQLIFVVEQTFLLYLLTFGF